MGAFEQPNEPITDGSHDGKTCEEMGHSRESHEQFLATKHHNLQGFSRVSPTAPLSEAVKKAERDSMPLNEWRNKELNSLLMTRFGIVAPHAVLGEQSKKTDPYKEEAKSTEKKKPSEKDPYEDLPNKRRYSKGSKPDYLDLDKDGDKSEPMKQAAKQAKHGGEKESKKDEPKKAKGKVPPQLAKYVEKKKK